MQRRDFLKAGAAGMALTLAQGSAQAQVEPRADVKGADAKDTREDLSVVVIGVDGSDLSPAYVDEYQRSGADVWQYSGNVMDDSRFQKLNDFVDSPSSKITMAKSYSDILAAKRAGKVAMVVGCQDCMVFERAAKGTIGVLTRRPRPFPTIMKRGSGSPTSPIISPIHLAVAALTRRPL
jgi:hypothetical protein